MMGQMQLEPVLDLKMAHATRLLERRKCLLIGRCGHSRRGRGGNGYGGGSAGMPPDLAQVMPMPWGRWDNGGYAYADH